MPPRVKEDDRCVRRLQVNAGGVDAGPDIVGRLTEQRERSDLGLNLSHQRDDFGAGVVDAQTRRVLNSVALERPVKLEDEEYLILRQSDILAVVERAKAKV
jgi:hypothetical protein